MNYIAQCPFCKGEVYTEVQKEERVSLGYLDECWTNFIVKFICYDKDCPATNGINISVFSSSEDNALEKAVSKWNHYLK